MLSRGAISKRRDRIFNRIQQTWGDAAIALLNPKRHSPNSLIVDLAANIIDDPMFPTVFHGWKTANSHIKLTDHLDEIETEMDVLESKGARNRIVQR